MHVPIELKMKYLKKRTQDIEKIRVFLSLEDFQDAAKLGHQVKGNAVTFEFPQMACLGIEIEKAALNRDREALSVLLSKMENMILEAQNQLH
jgi:HPt (histidine-containing phosphotransfer) domain-containing protein